MFNWRFIFDFKYLKAEDRIQKVEEEALISFEKPQEVKIPAILQLQCWDAEMLGSDNFIGTLSLISHLVTQVHFLL